MNGKASIDPRLAVQRREDPSWLATPGKRSLTDGAVQQRAAAGAAPGRGGVQQAAQRGVAGGAQALPFRDVIQRAFGRHNVGGITAHIGGPASEACNAMGATAYANGERIAFAGAPDLHTAAHEAAHVVQQRGGVQLEGGVGKAGDGYEQHADEVADLVVAGKSAEGALDRHAGGSSKQAIQHRLIVGGKPIRADEVSPHLANALSLNQINLGEMGEQTRLETEARDKQDYDYPSWLAAVQGLVHHGADSLGSLALHAGSITFTNANKKYAQRAQQLIDLIAQHPSIGRYINNRPCFITLINSPSNPASVIDLKKQVNIELAYWYFETYELGYTLGMLCHEFAVHPMADIDPVVSGTEPMQMGHDIDTGFKNGKQAHTVNTKQAGQVDHIFASMYGMPRNRVYFTAVIEMAELLAAEAAKKGSTIQPEEITNLLDCFMMDCASILATNDHRDKGAKVPGLVATIYNDYRSLIPKMTTDKTVVARVPGAKGWMGVAGDYMTVVGRLAKGQLSDASRERLAYQPTELQRTFLETHASRPRLHWIEPDGRCVFGALGHVAGFDAQTAILVVLARLEAGDVALTQLITNAGLTVPNVLRCIRGGRWADPHVGDIILEITAVALGLGVTVVQPNGTTLDINGGGRLIVRVTAPLEHYHSTHQ